MPSPGYNDSIFINCPFDIDYHPLLRAIVYTIYRCGFLPQTALNEDNALQNRLSKIEKCIENCRYGIHDISRTEKSPNGLPRFNMPFELGVFFGAKRFGNKHQKNKNAIIFDKERYRYQQYISDLNGVDIKAHNNDPFILIRSLLNWLNTASRRSTIPTYSILSSDYRKFTAALPSIADKLGFIVDEIPFNDYCLIVEEAVKKVLIS